MEIQFSSAGDLWPQYLRVLVGGSPGVGVTTFATTCPNPLFVMCNGGLSTLAKTPGIPYLRVNNEKDLFIAKEVASNPQDFPELNGYVPETLVIDSLDDLQRRLLLDRMKSEGRSETRIEDWGWIATRLNAIFVQLTSLPLHLIVTCRINSETGDLLLQGQFRDQIHNYVDYALAIQELLDEEWFDNYALRCEEGDVDTYNLAAHMVAKRTLLHTPSLLWTHGLVEFRQTDPMFESLWDIHTTSGGLYRTSELVGLVDHDEAVKILAAIMDKEPEALMD